MKNRLLRQNGKTTVVTPLYITTSQLARRNECWRPWYCDQHSPVQRLSGALSFSSRLGFMVNFHIINTETPFIKTGDKENTPPQRPFVLLSRRIQYSQEMNADASKLNSSYLLRPNYLYITIDEEKHPIIWFLNSVIEIPFIIRTTGNNHVAPLNKDHSIIEANPVFTKYPQRNECW